MPNQTQQEESPWLITARLYLIDQFQIHLAVAWTQWEICITWLGSCMGLSISSCASSAATNMAQPLQKPHVLSSSNWISLLGGRIPSWRADVKNSNLLVLHVVQSSASIGCSCGEQSPSLTRLGLWISPFDPSTSFDVSNGCLKGPLRSIELQSNRQNDGNDGLLRWNCGF